MIQLRSYNATYFRPKQQCNAILVVVVCLSTIGDSIDYIDAYEKVSVFYYFFGDVYIHDFMKAVIRNVLFKRCL